MSSRRIDRWSFASLILAAGLTIGCGAGVEGKYYNAQTGEFAMELKGGKVLMAQGMGGIEMTYTVHGDSVILHGPGGADDMLVVMRQRDGSLSAGLLGSLKKK